MAALTTTQVSDDDYYRDFYGREDIARNVNLDRQAWLNYSDKLLGGSFDGSLRVQKISTLANQDGYKDEPYAIMPRLTGRWQSHIGKAQLNVLANSPTLTTTPSKTAAAWYSTRASNGISTTNGLHPA